MYQTFKLCNARDCEHGEFPKCPHNAVNPCNVYYDEGTGMWHHEITSQVVTPFNLKDGRYFDVQVWLHGQMKEAFVGWRPGKKVHEPYCRQEPIMKPSGYPAKPPKYSNEELDGISDNFIRSRNTVEQVSKEVADLGQEIHGYERMLKKWNGNAMIQRRIDELREERNALRQVQSDMDRGSQAAKRHLKADHLYTKRWVKPKGRWSDYVLFYEDKQGRIWIIDRNGLRVDANYLYLPEEDKKYMESAAHASRMHNIPTNAWQKLFVPAEAIGEALRRFGKKNANGQRIRARAEQRRYCIDVLDMLKFLKAAKVNVDQFGDDDDLWERYEKDVAPRLTRR